MMGKVSILSYSLSSALFYQTILCHTVGSDFIISLAFMLHDSPPLSRIARTVHLNLSQKYTTTLKPCN
uniref:Uncharacterized protein n=1 Tax=Anopheles darlingi TaxID=43151 RepID=A0A2M4DG75_ANODA